jgi:hypothetical protein
VRGVFFKINRKYKLEIENEEAGAELMFSS